MLARPSGIDLTHCHVEKKAATCWGSPRVWLKEGSLTKGRSLRALPRGKGAFLLIPVKTESDRQQCSIAGHMNVREYYQPLDLINAQSIKHERVRWSTQSLLLRAQECSQL